MSNGYTNEKLANLYDVLNAWGPSDDFYLQLVMDADAALDIGCGTGMLLRKARESGHSGRLVGLDPAGPMLDVGRRDRADIEWTHGDLSSVRYSQEFDLVVMTGHAFQEFVQDDQLCRTLAAVRDALTDDGRFAFETRNPAVRPWERWTPEHAFEIDYPGGGVIRGEHDVDLPVEGDVVSFTSRCTAPTFEGTEISHSTLRFLDADSLAGFLVEAGLVIEAQYGDWDRSPLTDTSPEIITIARRDA